MHVLPPQDDAAEGTVSNSTWARRTPHRVGVNTPAALRQPNRTGPVAALCQLRRLWLNTIKEAQDVIAAHGAILVGINAHVVA